ncbi:unnamed protein product [Meloidogyne enterolobii]|uniref:Uncharacterized protein n=1 Tax=Meloidogyne enterolobii TaxID=390850 RepID=A0ACB0YFS4_MELEN
MKVGIFYSCCAIFFLMTGSTTKNISIFGKEKSLFFLLPSFSSYQHQPFQLNKSF